MSGTVSRRFSATLVPAQSTQPFGTQGLSMAGAVSVRSVISRLAVVKESVMAKRMFFNQMEDGLR